MPYYYSEQECSLCFVKGHSIPLVSRVSAVSYIFFSFFFKRTRLGHTCRSVQGVASARRMSDIGMTPQMKCICFLVHKQLHNFGTKALFVCFFVCCCYTEKQREPWNSRKELQWVKPHTLDQSNKVWISINYSCSWELSILSKVCLLRSLQTFHIKHDH